MTPPASRTTPAGAQDPAALSAVLDDPVELTARLCDIPSVSGDEARIADAVEGVLGMLSAAEGPDLEIVRSGDALSARTRLGRDERVLVAGHLDTVPVEDNLPTDRRVLDGREVVWGRGACDMKAGVAMQLAVAHALRAPVRDVTWVFYDQDRKSTRLHSSHVAISYAVFCLNR